jgi:hypothetical protein
VVWSEPVFVTREWRQQSVSATAAGTLITVFLRARGADTGKHQRVLFDDVELNPDP